MRKFISGGTKFYFMGPGEKVPDVHEDRSFVGAYVIWRRKSGKWDVRWKLIGEWEEISDRQFDTENEAFNFAYDHYVNRK